jgi:hypothetical protein
VIHLWLGDKGSDDGARAAFDGDGGVKQEVAPLLDNYSLEVRQFSVSNSNTIYRIYVGPIESVEKAQQLCGEIKKHGVDKCQPVIN